MIVDYSYPDDTDTFQAILRDLPDPVCIFEFCGTCVFANDALASLLGLSSPHDILNRNLLEFIHPDYIPTVKRDLEVLREKAVPLFSDYELFIPDRKNIWVVIQGVRIDFRGKKLILACIRDISHRKETEQILKEEKELFRQITENMADMIARCDKTGRITYASPSYTKNLGYQPEELIGTSYFSYIHPDERDEARRDLALMLDGRLPSLRFRHLLPGGEYRWMESTGKMLFSDKGRAIGSIIGTRDISERVAIEESLKKSREKLGILSSITRHDILNQLQAMDLFCNLLEQKNYQTDWNKEYLFYIRKCSDIIRKQISFTKDYQELGDNAPVWQNIETMVRMVAVDHLPESVTLTVSAAGWEIFADPMLMLVFYNLFENAIRHGETISGIRVACTREGSLARLVIEDDGVGVPDEHKRDIFEKGTGKNSGLGLFLVREILSITGISIRETGEFGKGARFEICIPGGMWRCEQDDSREDIGNGNRDLLL